MPGLLQSIVWLMALSAALALGMLALVLAAIAAAISWPWLRR